MNKQSMFFVLLMSAAVPAYAQNNSGSTPAQTAPNSGAGAQGIPGSKSGPAIRSDRSSNQPTGTAGYRTHSKFPVCPATRADQRLNRLTRNSWTRIWRCGGGRRGSLCAGCLVLLRLNNWRRSFQSARRVSGR